MRTLIQYITYPFRILSKPAIVLILIASVSLNVASLTLDAVNRFLSFAVEMVAEGTSLRERKSRARAKLQTELDAQKTTALEARRELESETKRTRRVNDELVTERKNRAVLVNDLEVAKAKNADLTTKSSALKSEVDLQNRRAASLSEELTLERQNTRKLRKDSKALRIQHEAEIKDKNVTLERVRKKFTRDTRSRGLSQSNVKRVDELTNKIAGRSAARITRGLGASAAEAVPFVGAAVVVVSLLWDAKDACDTMTNMDEIRESLSLDATIDTSQKGACSKVMSLFSSKKGDLIQKCNTDFQTNGTVSDDCKKISKIIDLDEEEVSSTLQPLSPSIDGLE